MYVRVERVHASVVVVMCKSLCVYLHVCEYVFICGCVNPLFCVSESVST